MKIYPVFFTVTFILLIFSNVLAKQVCIPLVINNPEGYSFESETCYELPENIELKTIPELELPKFPEFDLPEINITELPFDQYDLSLQLDELDRHLDLSTMPDVPQIMNFEEHYNNLSRYLYWYIFEINVKLAPTQYFAKLWKRLSTRRL